MDIDEQAVEVTQLSLMLKMLEGEYGIIPGRAILPMLDKNIKCGNSLVSGDILELKKYFGDDWYKLKPFNWEDEFREIMKEQGGFDVVIGNPPYVRPHKLWSAMKEYFWQYYSTFIKKSDLYCCFIERGVLLLKKGGFFGQIISNSWLRLDSFENLRKLLLNETSLKKIIDFTGNVFKGAIVKTAILLFQKEKPSSNTVEVIATDVRSDLEKLRFKNLRQDFFRKTYKCMFDLSLSEPQQAVKNKIKRVSVQLGDLFDISFGLKTGDDSKFLSYSKDGANYRPLLRGEDIHRYSLKFKGEYVWYVPDKMRAYRQTARPGTAERFEQPKVLIRDTGGGLQGTFDAENYYAKDVLIISGRDVRQLKFAIGILNSRLLRFYYETSFPTLHVQHSELASLPIPNIAFFNSSEKKLFDNLVALVDVMLDLNKKVQIAKGSEREQIQRQIEKTDKEIDDLVYKLYGINEEERKIIEQETDRS